MDWGTVAEERLMRALNLESKLAEARAENERMTAEVSRRNAYWSGMCDRLAVELGSCRERAEKAEAECEELRADVEWVARVGICQFINGENVLFTMTTPTIFMRHDGTPADILRTVREARNGGNV